MGSSALAPTQHHTMLSLIIFTLVAAASAAPQIVPYVHEEIPAEPYVHQEPALTPEALGNVAYSAPVVATGYAAGPVVAGAVAGAWNGACINNLGAVVPCRQ